MPELIEVELYRSALNPLIGNTIDAITIPDPAFIRPKGTPGAVFDQVVGLRLVSTTRRGKLLVLHLGGDDVTIGLRFGMTGRLLLDGAGPIDALEYASARNEPSWDRAIITIDGTQVAIRDQRRLGSIELDPDVDALGPDAAQITFEQLSLACEGRSKSIKALLLDQRRIAGLGNLLVDEVLWQAAVDPSTPTNTLEPERLEDIANEVRSTVKRLTARGGSHTGDTFEQRLSGASCARCGGGMVHDTIGGRSTWWCAGHQR